ncbi:PAS domain S-box protein [Oleomonas cavernae]|uniref:PAS domain S-box protein n=1 Tax=Oleomonas cavernae TaxID=2320859 RepID=A0A418VTM1_9PROT|nr:PAS domain-containing protein [Oleomonas cavernae]RJF80486.1 PAS domain S-box protein [Oleomonas cavernae]
MPATVAHVTLSTGFASRILDVDEAFAAMTGWRPEEANGQTLGILFGPWSNQQMVDRLLRALERGEGTDHLALKLYRHDGATFDAAVSLDVAEGEPGQPRPATCTIRNQGDAVDVAAPAPRGRQPWPPIACCPSCWGRCAMRSSSSTIRIGS